MIAVHVDSKDFLLPRGLLCYNSDFFDRALNGYYTEATQDYILLPRCSAETFELVIQWLYHAKIILPTYKEYPRVRERTAISKGIQKSDAKPGLITTPVHEDVSDDSDDELGCVEISPQQVIETLPQHTIDTKAHDIARLLSFLKLADRIMLLGSFNEVIGAIKALLLESRSSLQPEHIRSATELPAGHGVRKLFAQASVRDYLASRFSGTKKGYFKFEKELEEVEGFAADLFKEYDQTFLQRRTQWSSEYEYLVTDPLDGTTLRYKVK